MGDIMEKIEVQKLMKILDERDIMFTVEDIRELMNSELDKPPSEMDTELVDLCAAVIGRQYSTKGYVNPPLSPEAEAEIDAALAQEDAVDPAEPESEQEAETDTVTPEPVSAPTDTHAKRKFKFGKVLLIAAVIVILCVVAIPAGARFFPSETSDKIIDFCYDHFKINLRGESKPSETSEGGNDLVNSLILESLHTLKLPEVLLSDEYEKSVRTQQSDVAEIIYVDIANSTSNISGNIMITQYKDAKIDIVNGTGNVSSMYKYFEQVSVNNREILVFGEDNKIYINYIDNNTEYEIALLNIDFDAAVKIAESIK